MMQLEGIDAEAYIRIGDTRLGEVEIRVKMGGDSMNARNIQFRCMFVVSGSFRRVQRVIMLQERLA